MTQGEPSGISLAEHFQLSLGGDVLRDAQAFLQFVREQYGSKTQVVGLSLERELCASAFRFSGMLDESFCMELHGGGPSEMEPGDGDAL